MIYGYARVSTAGQAASGNSLADQQEQLTNAGCQDIIVEQYTGSTTHRPAFIQLLDKLQPDDTLVVTKLDRIARNAGEGINLINDLMKKGIKVHILNIGLLDNTPTGKLIANIMLAFAQFERDMIIERTQAGKAIASQKNGFVDGRPRIPKSRTEHALGLLESGMSYKQVAEVTGISISTLARRVREKRAEYLP
ncbi:MAG: recombinase family protein [Selenomonadaceae bacterium]|nr:recombinase family protein [Selenomonadaceae bacterium]